MVYSLKDGPGEKAKDMGWANDANLYRWVKEGSLIDL